MNRPLKNLMALLMLICFGATNAWTAEDVKAVNDATNVFYLYSGMSRVEMTYDDATGSYTGAARLEIHSEFYFTDANGNRYGSAGGDAAYVTTSTTPTLQPDGEPFYMVSGGGYYVTIDADYKLSVRFTEAMLDIDPSWEIYGETTAMDDIIGTHYLEPGPDGYQREFTITEDQLADIGVFKFYLQNGAMHKTYMADVDHCQISSTNCTNLPLHYYTDASYTYFEISQPGTYKVIFHYGTTMFNLSVESNWPTTSGYKLGYIQTADGTPLYAEFTYDEVTGAYTMHSPLAKGCRYWIEDAEGNRYGMSGNETMTRLNDEISLIEAGLTVEWITYSCDSLSLTVNASGVPVSLKGEGWPVPGIYIRGLFTDSYKLLSNFKFAERYGHPGEFVRTGYIEGAQEWQRKFEIIKINDDASYCSYGSPYFSHDGEENSTDVPMVEIGSGAYMFNLPEGYYTFILNFNETTPTITISGWPGYYIYGSASDFWQYLNEYKFTEVADAPGVYRLTAEIRQPQYGSLSFCVADKKLENSQTATPSFLGATTSTGSGIYMLTEDNSTNVPLILDGSFFEVQSVGTYTFELNTTGDTPTFSVVNWGGNTQTSTYEMAYDYSLPGWVFEYDAETDTYFTVQTVEAGKEIWVDIDGGEVHCTHTGNMVIDKNNATNILLIPNGDGGTLTMAESGTYTFRFKITDEGQLLFSVEWPVPKYYLNDEYNSVERKIPFTYKGNGVYELKDIEFVQGYGFWFKREFNGVEEYYGYYDGNFAVTRGYNSDLPLSSTGADLSMSETGTYTLIINEQEEATTLTVRFPMPQIRIAYNYSELDDFVYDATTNTYSLEFTADAGRSIYFLNKTSNVSIHVPEAITLDRNNSKGISLIEGGEGENLFMSNGGRYTFKLKPTDNGYLLNVEWPEPNYSLSYGPTSPGYSSSTPFTKNGDGTWTLEVNLADAPDLLNVLDEKDLLFTGTGYTLEEIYFVEGEKVPIWTNDGWLGEINWTGVYRFGIESYKGDNECYIVPQDVWDKMKSQPFFVTLKGANPTIRVTSGWWDTKLTADDIVPGYDKLTHNGEGNWTATLTITEDWANDNQFTIGIDDLSLFVDGVSTMYGYGVPNDYSTPTIDNSQNIPLVCGYGSYSLSLPAGTYTFIINPDHTLSIEWPFEQRKFYIVGTMTNNYDWLNSMEEMAYNEQNNAYEYVLTVGDVPVIFSIADKILASYDDFDDMNANHRYAPADSDDPTELTTANTPIQLYKQKGEMKITAPGTYKLSLSPDLMLSVVENSGQASTDLVINGDMEGDDASCFFKREQIGANPDAVVPTTFTEGAGKNGSRGIIIHSVDNPSAEWDTEFFIRLTESLPAGTRYRISFDYKASQDTIAYTQMHAEPTQYLWWNGIGTLNFTTEWQHFEYKGTLTKDQSHANQQMRTIAFNLNVSNTATDYYFDNIVVELVDDHYYMVYDFDQDNKIEMTYNPSTMSYETTIAVEKDKDIWFEDDNGTPFNSLMDYSIITESNCTNLSVVSEGQKCNFTMGASGELTFALRETNNGLKLDVTGWPEREKIYLYAPSIVGWDTVSASEMQYNPETNAYEYEMDDANWMLIYLFSINPQSWNDINSENAYTVSGATDGYKLSPNNNSVQLEKGPAVPIVANLPGNYKISIDADTKVLTLTGFNQYYYWTRGTSEVVGDVVEMTYNNETEEFEATLTVGDNESKTFYIADAPVGENDYQDHSYMGRISELVPDNSTDIELEQIYYSNGMYIATPGTYKLCLRPRLMRLTVKGWTGTDISQLDNAIYSDKAQGCKGGSGTIAISLKNAQEAVAYQFDLKLPEGVTLKTDDNGDLIYRLSGRHNGHTVRYSYDENTDSYTFVVIAIPTKSLSDNDGIILTLGIDIADNVALGKYRFYIQNPSYTLNDGYRVTMNETTNLLSADYYLLGDVNRDGDVDVSDVVCIVNHKIGKPNLDFVEEAADVDFDGEIDIADAVKLVNYIIKKISVLSHGVTGPVSISEPEPEFVPEPQ